MNTDADTGFSWICPSCGRRVPKSVVECGCGLRREPTTDLMPPPADSLPAIRSRARTLTIHDDDLRQAVVDGVVSQEQADALWAALEKRALTRPRFDGAHVAYYAGAVLVLGAMGWFMTTAWGALGGFALTLIAVAYASAFWFGGDRLWRQGMAVPGGLLFTLAVWMVPLAIYGIEEQTGLWPQDAPGTYRNYYEWVRGSWIAMEAGTILAGAVGLRLRPFAFLTFPMAFALWFMSMDLTPLLFGRSEFTWDERKIVSLWFGLAILLAAYVADLQNRLRQDFAFWGYVFGLLAFWGGLSLLEGSSELSKALYCLINLALIVVSVLLRQRSFLVFGAIGTLGYVGHLSYAVFEDSLAFPVVLTAIGVGLIYLGVLYKRNAGRIADYVQTSVPGPLRALIPPRARALG
jgi:hypothetical protein